MFRRPVIMILAGLSMAVAACTGAAIPAVTSSGATSLPAPTTTTSVPGTTTTTAATTSTTAPNPEETLALITETGIPVAVIDESSSGFLVLTPCGFEAEVGGGEELGPTRVVLDPGHGGPTDTGAVGANGLAEKDLNLAVVRSVASILADRDIEAVLTRVADYTTPLFVRANLADTLEAELMVSIHHNAPTPGPSDEPGVEIFVQEGSRESARLGGLLWEHTRSGLRVFDVAWTAAPDAGVMTVLNSRGDDAYGIIRHPETTTALVELGYISNPPEAELFATPEYVEAAAEALADAVEAYLLSDAQGSGFVEGRVFNPSPGVSREACTDPLLR